MKTKVVSYKSKIKRNKSYVGESIETMLRRRIEGATVEVIGTGMEKKGFYTEKSEGVRPDTNIRTDKFEQMREAKFIEHNFNKLKEEKLEAGAENKGAETASTDGKN